MAYICNRCSYKDLFLLVLVYPITSVVIERLEFCVFADDASHSQM